jgi:hypothetical protein
MVKGERKPSLGERLKKTTDDMIEAKHAYSLSQNMFGNGDTRAVDTQQILDRKAHIAAQLIGMKYPPELVRSYSEAIGPFLDSSTFASDPFAQRFMIERFQQGQAPTRDSIIEAVRLGAEMKNSQPQTDMGQLANALAVAMQSGVQAAKGNGSADPLALMTMLNQNQQQSHQQQLQMYERLLESQQPRTLTEQLKDMQHMQETLGKLGGADTPEIQMKKLELTEARDSRQFSAVQEEKKTKAQTEMFKTIAGGLSKALESPVLRQLGRNVGSKLGVENPIAKAQNAAAQEVVQNPTAVPWGFNCPKCHTSHSFTAIQLAKIKDSGGRWVDPVCGEVYSLQAPPGGDPFNDKDNVSPS